MHDVHPLRLRVRSHVHVELILVDALVALEKPVVEQHLGLAVLPVRVAPLAHRAGGVLHADCEPGKLVGVLHLVPVVGLGGTVEDWLEDWLEGLVGRRLHRAQHRIERGVDRSRGVR